MYVIGQTVNQQRMATIRAGGEALRLTHWETEAGQWTRAIGRPERSNGLKNIWLRKLE